MNSLAMKDFNEDVDRRRWARNAADSKYDAHRFACSTCKGKTFSEVRGRSHACELGRALADIAFLAHRDLLR